jgi:thioredoxin 1
VIDEIARDRDDVVVGKVNVDEAPAIAQQYGIQGIPFIGLFENGQLVKNAVGAMPRAGIEQALGLS